MSSSQGSTYISGFRVLLFAAALTTAALLYRSLDASPTRAASATKVASCSSEKAEHAMALGVPVTEMAVIDSQMAGSVTVAGTCDGGAKSIIKQASI